VKEEKEREGRGPSIKRTRIIKPREIPPSRSYINIVTDATATTATITTAATLSRAAIRISRMRNWKRKKKSKTAGGKKEKRKKKEGKREILIPLRV